MNSHLSTKAAELLLLSDEQRIENILKPKWIGYPGANTALNLLSDLLKHPKCHRMPNLLIVGDTNNGKTMIAKKFLKSHPSDDNLDGDAAKVPVLYIQAPAVPDEHRFYNIILETLFSPFKTSDRIDRKLFQVKTVLNRVDNKMIIIDEIHHIMAGNLNKQKVFLNVIKYLGNELEVPIVGIGTKEAESAIKTEPQLSNRFERYRLPLWKEDSDDYTRFLMSYEHILPLRKASLLYAEELAYELLTKSENLVGELTKLINKAAIMAIRDKSEKISLKTIKKLNWELPSAR